ncbi:MAG: peroxidase family protein, partial [Bosea sp. (in: a-proteobacteria)]
LTPTRTQQLSVSTASIADPDGLGAFSYQWQVSTNNGANWTNIAAATAPAFTPVTAQVGNLMRVQVTYTDGSGAATTLTSAPTGIVGNTIASLPVLNDTIVGTAGDDVVSWTIRNPGFFGTIGDGRDVVDGGAGSNDTFIVNGNNQAEIYRVYARADWLALGGARPLNGNTEIVITRGGTTNANVIAELDNIEEIIINTGAGNDQVFAIGNFNPTSLNFNTITINGSDGDDTVDITGLASAHRILFRSSGGQDTVIGNLRAQDQIEVPEGVDPQSYTETDNANGTKTLTSGTHSITFTGETPTLVVPTEEHGGGNSDGGTIPTGSFEYTARDIQGITNLVKGLPAFADDDDTEGAGGVRDLSGSGNNIDNPAFGAADQPFIRLTDARYGDGVVTDGQGNIINRPINPIFDGLDARQISNILGTQEADLPKAPNEANIFFMAFGQYFDHGLDFLPKGGAGKVIIDGADIPGPTAANFTDLNRGSLANPLQSATDIPEHLNKTSPYVDQNQVYGSNAIVGQLLRESDGQGSVGSRILMGPEDSSAPGFHLMSTLRELLDHHREAGTVFKGAGLPAAGVTIDGYYPTLWNSQTNSYDGAAVRQLAGNFMNTGHALLLDANPIIDLLDHYVGGDGRANENFTLTSMHTIWARNHNFHVEKLAEAGFMGTEEELFQAAKMVNEAEYQRVVFTEFAETLIGGIQGNGSHGFEAYNDQATA